MSAGRQVDELAGDLVMMSDVGCPGKEEILLSTEVDGEDLMLQAGGKHSETEGKPGYYETNNWEYPTMKLEQAGCPATWLI